MRGCGVSMRADNSRVHVRVRTGMGQEAGGCSRNARSKKQRAEIRICNFIRRGPQQQTDVTTRGRTQPRCGTRRSAPSRSRAAAASGATGTRRRTLDTSVRSAGGVCVHGPQQCATVSRCVRPARQRVCVSVGAAPKERKYSRRRHRRRRPVPRGA